MTPEERASICSHCLTDTTRSCHGNCTYYERYKAFIEQKAIDDKECESLVGLAVKECKQVMIDKACEFLKARLFPTVKVQDNEIYVIERWELIEEFRKAMTEKTNPLFEKCLANVDPDTRKEVRRNMDAVIKESLTPVWHKVSEELPPVDTEVVCKMKGVPHTEHFICKWDGEAWWHWAYFREDIQGWFGLNSEWEVTEWKEI